MTNDTKKKKTKLKNFSPGLDFILQKAKTVYHESMHPCTRSMKNLVADLVPKPTSSRPINYLQHSTVKVKSQSLGHKLSTLIQNTEILPSSPL